MRNEAKRIQNEKEEKENALKESERLRKEREDYENELKEIERFRKEKENKPKKIGDTYAGGIIFKIDASGKHGQVCAPKDQGRNYWAEAKNICENLTLNGFSDWYLPSKYELNLMYLNIGKGSSLGNIGGFNTSEDFYWSSSAEYSEKGIDCAWLQGFYNGRQSNLNKTNKAQFRAIRSF